MKDILKISDSKTLKILSKPLRMKILGAFANFEGSKASSTELSKVINLPPSNISYHLKVLEKANLIELIEVKQVKNLVEKVFRPVAKRFDLEKGGREVVSFVCDNLKKDFYKFIDIKEEGQNRIEGCIKYLHAKLTSEESEELNEIIEEYVSNRLGRDDKEEYIECRIGYFMVEAEERKGEGDE